MLSEVREAKRYLGARFGYGEPLPVGTYAVPCRAARGPCFMRVTVNDDGHMGGFDLFWDEACTVKYHDHPHRPTYVPAESAFAQAYRNLMETKAI